MIRRLFLLLLVPFFILQGAFATTYYLQILNPNDYDLTNFQIKINLTQYNISAPVAQITTLNGTDIPFCYEQPNGECNETESNIIWIKIPLIRAKDYTTIKIISNGSNGAVNGDQVFDFYDDFNDGIVSNIYKNIATDSDTQFEEKNGYFISKGSYNGWMGFRFTTPFDHRNIILETKLKVTDTQFDINFRGNDVDPYPNTWYGFTYEMWAMGPSGGLHWAKDIGGSWTRLGYDVTWDWNLNTWIVNRLVIKENEFCLYELSPTPRYKCFTDNDIPANNNQRTFMITTWWRDYLYRELYVDWIKIRKYADQDPIIKPAYSSFSPSLQSPSSTQSEYSQTYLYVRQVNVLPENTVSISSAPIIIELNTTKLISEGKMKSDCSDIYVTYYDPLYGEIPAKFWVDPTTCNTGRTRIYVKLPVVSVNNDYIINVYYGSPDAIPVWDPKNTFSFYVDLTNPSDISQNLIIRTSGAVSLDYTPSGLAVSTTSGGEVLIVNR